MHTYLIIAANIKLSNNASNNSGQVAGADELMVHIHFDAKYRVEWVNELLGNEADDSTFETEGETDTKARGEV